jgi:glyoxylase-like metal-dependent hydrolase (beta-lactamase superfamily II)
MRKTALSMLCFATAAVLAGGALAQQEPVRAIEHVTGDLYRAQNNQHFTVFLVTPEGIMLSDPINTQFAEWLKGELGERFDVPVRYVLYSHHHWDHASGGAVFADTAEFVGHETMAGALALPPADTPIPPQFAAMDADGDGVIDRDEAEGQVAANFHLYDADGDGRLTGAELARGPVGEVHPAETHYTGRHTVMLGGKSVEMIHVGPTHSPDMAVLRFPEERAVFLVDFISLKRLPFMTLPGMDERGLQDLVATIETVEAMDFEIAVPGHGDIGNKDDVRAHRQYLTELREEVARGIAEGKSLEELQRSVTMEAYSDWGAYEDWLPLNIAGMYRILTEES